MAIRAPAPPWQSFEVVLRGPDGKLDGGRKPFGEELQGGDGDEIRTALQKMLFLQSHGWPQAGRQLRDRKGRTLVDRADDKIPAIWILKAKPSCWRLYFHVYEQGRRIVYLYAKCKKKNPRDPGDSERARRIFEGIGGARGSGIVEFQFPSR